MTEPCNGVVEIIARVIAVVSIIIAVGIVTKQIPISEGTILLTTLIGGEVLIRLVLSNNRSNVK